ncbi:MAG: hypothetical protein WEB58_03035 [Planctomycetaceae bacterium]
MAITRANYQKDKRYPRVVRSMSELLAANDAVAPVDLLLKLQYLKQQQYEDWRFGRIPYLERVCTGSLGVLSRILRIMEFHSQAIGLKPSNTVYCRWGKGKRTVLRFSKSGDPRLEAAYMRHYLVRRKPIQGDEKRLPSAAEVTVPLDTPIRTPKESDASPQPPITSPAPTS